MWFVVFIFKAGEGTESVRCSYEKKRRMGMRNGKEDTRAREDEIYSCIFTFSSEFRYNLLQNA